MHRHITFLLATCKLDTSTTPEFPAVMSVVKYFHCIGCVHACSTIILRSNLQHDLVYIVSRDFAFYAIIGCEHITLRFEFSKQYFSMKYCNSYSRGVSEFIFKKTKERQIKEKKRFFYLSNSTTCTTVVFSISRFICLNVKLLVQNLYHFAASDWTKVGIGWRLIFRQFWFFWAFEEKNSIFLKLSIWAFFHENGEIQFVDLWASFRI